MVYSILFFLCIVISYKHYLYLGATIKLEAKYKYLVLFYLTQNVGYLKFYLQHKNRTGR